MGPPLQRRKPALETKTALKEKVAFGVISCGRASSELADRTEKIWALDEGRADRC